MVFKIGDKVKVTKDFLLRLPSYADRTKDGGIIVAIYSDEAEVYFHSGITYHIYFNSLELNITKNQQLLFNFMD